VRKLCVVMTGSEVWLCAVAVCAILRVKHVTIAVPTLPNIASELKRRVQALLQAVPGLSWLAGHSRKVTFRATNVDDACEWAIALREAIALAVSGR